MKTALVVLLCMLVFLIIFLFIVCAFIFNQLVWRKTIPIPKFITNLIAGNEMPDSYDGDSKKAVNAFYNMPLESVEFDGGNGETLRGYILVPEKNNGKLVLACHGARSSGIGEFCFMAPYLYDNGYTLVIPDHRGCGRSDGKYMGYGTHESNDTFLWLDYAKKRFAGQKIFLLGVSMGAATVLMMSDRLNDKDVKGVIADCSYTSAWEEFSYQLHTSFHLPDFPILHICDLYSRIFAGYSFKSASPVNAVKNAKKPILFIHGNKDDFVPFFMMDKLYSACASEKHQLVIGGAVHARSYYKNPTAYEEAMEEFMNFCIEKEAQNI